MTSHLATERQLNVTALSQYVRVKNCNRYLRFRLEPELQKRWNVTVQPLTPLLQESGREFERKVIERLSEKDEPVVDMEGQTAEDTYYWLSNVTTPVILLQPWLEAPLGNYFCRGRADIVRLSRNGDGSIEVYIADVKASRQERMEHRLQVAIYARLLNTMAEAVGVTIGRMLGGVVHMEDDGSVSPFDVSEPGFDLDTYYTILKHLILDEDSVTNRVAEQPFGEVFYHLGPWCDDCIFNRFCMHDSAERLDLSLVPAISAVQKRGLLAAGITNLRDLAALMTLSDGPPWEIKVAPGQEEKVRAVTAQWSVAAQLPILVQRAKKAMRRFDRSVRSWNFIVGSGFGTLPDDNEHPDLVKVFFDSQYDYLRNSVYLLSALVSGPGGEEIVVEYTDAPPTIETERALLVRWIGGVLRAVYKVSGSLRTPVHLYTYNRYDQWALLEALKRHLSTVAMLPGFFDLMTQSPATSQPIISFLASELQERRNLGAVCLPLHDAARALGFNWQDDEYQFFHIFRTRMFDNRHSMMRIDDGHLVEAPKGMTFSDPRFAQIESASRFNSQIPLEYAYGAWGALPDDGPDKRLLRYFQSVTLDQLVAFARHRVRALAYIEGSFKRKARFIDKPPIDLRALAEDDELEFSLAQGLKEFLFMEHHAAFQELMQIYSLPIDQRIQTGLALPLRFETYDQLTGVWRFALEFEAIGLNAKMAMNALRLKEGAWVVINEVDPRVSAGRIKNGRLAVIHSFGDGYIELDLKSFRTNQTRFRYYHKTDLAPEPGELYTLDSMADDMNADKALEALNNAASNTLYHWIVSGAVRREVEPKTMSEAQKFAEHVNMVEYPFMLTESQREIVAGQLEEPLFLVQGPPGTGKSHTLGWAILSRILLCAAQGRQCRVAVSSKTHNAVNIVLQSVAEKWQRLLSTYSGEINSAVKMGLQFFKLVNDPDETVPDSVSPLHAYSIGAGDLEKLLTQPFLIIGGTPGGLYNLAKYRQSGGRKVDWDNKPFDLVVIDEASQMSLPEAILACSFLHGDGSAIVVGDHRQMPPIIAHEWKEEEKRTVVELQPHLSLFESLIRYGFPRVSLDESFRLHVTIARFLQENIYVHDGINFFSRRTTILPDHPNGDPLVNIALSSAYPIIVIEHGEQSSQQYNETELAIIEPLITACTEQLRLNGADGIGVVVPHRAQRALLRDRFPELAAADSIDTVERFQGGERDVIIVSATASDPDYVLAEADFLLNLNRLNVALSRPRKKLIVVASQSVTKLLVSDLDIFSHAVIWKRLYYNYAEEVLWRGRVGQVAVSVRGRTAVEGSAEPFG